MVNFIFYIPFQIVNIIHYIIRLNLFHSSLVDGVSTGSNLSGRHTLWLSILILSHLHKTMLVHIHTPTLPMVQT